MCARANMLLRSSSNPVIESLLPLPLQVSCSSDPSADIKHELNQLQLGDQAAVPKCLSFTSSSRGSNSSSLTHSDILLQISSPLGPCCSASFTSIRKVFSESDLFVLAESSPSSTSPAQFAANSLVQDGLTGSCDPCSSNLDVAFSRSPHSHVKKSTSPLGLSRWRSLGSIPSEFLSVLHDSDSAIEEEEGDLASPINPSATLDEGKERERRIGNCDQLALPFGDTSNLKVEQAVRTTDHVRFMIPESSLSQNVSDKRNAQRTRGELDGETVGLEMNFSLHGVDAGFPGSENPCTGGQDAFCLFEGGTGTAVCQPMHVCETALGAGAGGRGNRPPSIGARRGGWSGGDAGGCGGRNPDSTELHYQSVLKESPGHPLILQNYAQYLAEVKHDNKRAEEFFERAILVNPGDGELLAQYAKLLWEVRQDRGRAAAYFERAVQAAPDNSYVMAAYASFLWNTEEDEEEQESVEEVVKGSNPVNVSASVFSLVSTGLS